MKEVLDIQNRDTDVYLKKIADLAFEMNETQDFKLGIEMVYAYKEMLRHNGIELTQLLDILEDL